MSLETVITMVITAVGAASGLSDFSHDASGKEEAAKQDGEQETAVGG